MNDFRGVHISDYIGRPQPRRPWDVRLRQWLLQADVVYWLLVLLAIGLTFVVCSQVMPPA